MQSLEGFKEQAHLNFMVLRVCKATFARPCVAHAWTLLNSNEAEVECTNDFVKCWQHILTLAVQ